MTRELRSLEPLDPEAVHNALQDLDRYRSFVQAVRDYLESIGALDD
jgi:hypothetical protein